MNLRNSMLRTILIILTFFLFSCRERVKREESSNVLNIMNDGWNYPCDNIKPSPNLSGFVFGKNDETFAVAEYLSAIPKSYFQHILTKGGYLERGIFVRDEEFMKKHYSLNGRPILAYYSATERNINIFFLQIFYSMRHEFGHAVQDFYDSITADESNKKKFTAKVHLNYREHVERGKEKTFMNPNSIRHTREYFADIFSSYYCSAAARQVMADKFPGSYKFAQDCLLKPEEINAKLSIEDFRARLTHCLSTQP